MFVTYYSCSEIAKIREVNDNSAHVERQSVYSIEPLCTYTQAIEINLNRLQFPIHVDIFKIYD